MLVWMGVLLFGILVTLIFEVLQLLAIQAAVGTVGKTGWATTMSNEWLMVMAGQALTGTIMAMNKKSWWHAQKIGMGEEKSADAEVKTEALLGFFGF